jgi:hypothetical protein
MEIQVACSAGVWRGARGRVTSIWAMSSVLGGFLEAFLRKVLVLDLGEASITWSPKYCRTSMAAADLWTSIGAEAFAPG